MTDRTDLSVSKVIEKLDKKIEKKAKREKLLKDIFGWLISIIFILGLAFIFNIPQHFYWQKVPGSLFEKQHYTAVVYVKVYPYATGNKYYWLKGVIERDNTCDNSFALYDDSSSCSLAYNLQGFRWPNGGIAYFDSCPVDFHLLRFSDKDLNTGCDTDSKDSRTYYIQLTNVLVKR